MKHRITALLRSEPHASAHRLRPVQMGETGVSDAEMNKKLTECEAQALIDLPPDNVVTGSDSENGSEEQEKGYFHELHG